MRIRRRAALPVPDLRTPWREAEFCAIDLETTGLDLRSDEIISYGAAIVRQARIPCGEVVYRQLRPSREVSVDAMKVHGLRSADLADAPGIDELLDEIVGLLAGRVPVAHAAWVERAFLDRALRPGRRLNRIVIDTAALLRAARLAGGSGREPDLEVSARQLGLPVHTPHHALGDAFTTAELLLALATRMERNRRRPLTIADLYAVSRHHQHVEG
ncbi:exonuclease domain-containing protein [Phytohabitans houttuyneae]|uniref:DNA polymerase III subunit epsilon n=1 Tax=Phytohabitans houttuyneae TaxID=1076126 RepID=A0A6V8KHR4_9ACTN|nr:exonuclease domain-containing protein [Phytohabitans houttuyneae]GFJ81639.1 DNA polymerase III subunit epsilon [Phytohabitans houttuyneae]